MAHLIPSVLLFSIALTCCYAELLPAIVWDSTNPIFSCDDPEILVKMGDKLNIVCPNKGVNTQNLNQFASTSNLYESVHLLNPTQEDAYKRCDSTTAKPIITCDRPNSLKFSTISFKRYASSSSMPTFREGNTYYLLATSFRTSQMLKNKLGGSCNNRKYSHENYLKLKIRVCTSDEINVYKNCSVASSVESYAKACMSCGPKRQYPSADLLQIGSKCFAVKEEQQCWHKKTNKAQKFQTMEESLCNTNNVGKVDTASSRCNAVMLERNNVNRICGRMGHLNILFGTNIIQTGKTSASSSAQTGDSDSSKTTIIYVAVGTCLACFIGGIMLGLLIMKRKRIAAVRRETRRSQKQNAKNAQVSFNNGGFVTKDGSLEIKPATVGSPSKVYGNFEY